VTPARLAAGLETTLPGGLVSMFSQFTEPTARKRDGGTSAQVCSRHFERGKRLAPREEIWPSTQRTPWFTKGSAEQKERAAARRSKRALVRAWRDHSPWPEDADFFGFPLNPGLETPALLCGSLGIVRRRGFRGFGGDPNELSKGAARPTRARQKDEDLRGGGRRFKTGWPRARAWSVF